MQCKRERKQAYALEIQHRKRHLLLRHFSAGQGLKRPVRPMPSDTFASELKEPGTRNVTSPTAAKTNASFGTSRCNMKLKKEASRHPVSSQPAPSPRHSP